MQTDLPAMIRYRAHLTLISLLIAAGLLFADQAGFSDITMHDGSGGNTITMHIGEEADIYIHLNSHAELLTGFQLMLTLQENVLELVPGSDGLPFQQVGEGFFAPCGGANILANEVQEDPDNPLPGTQLAYVIQTGQGESPRPSCANDTDILHFRVRAMSEFAGQPITVDQENYNFRNTLYWQAESNAQWDFNLELTPQFIIADFAFFPPLPDLHLTTALPRDTLNVYDHLEAFFCPDTEFTIEYEAIIGDSAATIDTLSTGEEFFFIFTREPGIAALMEVMIQATAPDSIFARDTMQVLCDDPPQISIPLPDMIISEDSIDSTLVLDDWVTDNDHDAHYMNYSVPLQSIVRLDVDPVSHRAILTPPANWYGIDTVAFVVTDPLGLSDSAAIAVEVLSVNDAPQLAGNLNFPLYPGSELVLSLDDLVSDPDHAWNELEWNLTGTHDSISTVLDTYEGTLRFFTTALSLIDESLSYQLTVADPEPLLDQDTLWVLVQSAPPLISTIPAQVIHNGNVELLYLDDYVADADHADSELSWTFSGNSLVDVHIDVVTHVATLTAGPYMQGWETVTFEVVDPDENSASIGVPVVILFDYLPQVAAVPDLFMLPGTTCDSLDLDDYVWDYDNTPEEMTWVATEADPFQLQINPESHQLTVIAPLSTGSWRDVTLFCFDPDSNLAGDDCRLLVIDTTGTPLLLPFPQIQMPTLSSSGPWQLDDLVYDHDDPVEELHWSCLDGALLEAELDTVSRTVTFFSLLETGMDSVWFTATDPDGNYSSAWWTLQITSGEAPQLAPFPLTTLRAGECDTLHNLSGYVYDPDSPDQYLDWEIESHNSVTVTYQPSSDCLLICSDSLFFGSAIIELTVTDNDNNSDSGMLVVISLENIPPGITSSILPNPAINEYLDLLLISDEELRTVPQGDGNGNEILFTLLQEPIEPEGYSLYQGSWLFGDESSVTISLTATDLVGNVAHDTLLISSGYMHTAGDIIPGPVNTYELLQQENLRLQARCVMQDLSHVAGPGLKLLPQHLPGAIRLIFNVGNDNRPDTPRGIFQVMDGDTTWCNTYFTAGGEQLYTELTEGGTYLLRSSVQEPLQAPTSWALSSPRPNPFNPSTSFTLSLLSGEHVTAAVYNLLGRRVALLWDGYLAAGEQELVFDSTVHGNLASGIYFLQVQSIHLHQTRKMMLIK
jgi:hypothetical protein